MKNMLQCLCVLFSRFWVVNSHILLIQAHLTLYPFWKKCFLKVVWILVSYFVLSISWKSCCSRSCDNINFFIQLICRNNWLIDTYCFSKGFEKTLLSFVFSVRQKQSVILIKQLVVLCEIHNRKINKSAVFLTKFCYEFQTAFKCF